MKHAQLLGAVLLLLATSCQQDDADTLPSTEQRQPFSLVDPRPGQVAAFERISLTAGSNAATAHPDTLLLELIDATSSALIVEERLSEHSLSQAAGGAVAFPTRTLTYTVQLEADGLSIGTSVQGAALDARLFPSISGVAHTIAFARGQAEAVQLLSDRVSAPYLPLDRAYQISGAPDLTAALYHDYRDQALPGFTFVHDRTSGLHCVLTEHDLAGNASGWRRID